MSKNDSDEKLSEFQKAMQGVQQANRSRTRIAEIPDIQTPTSSDHGSFQMTRQGEQQFGLANGIDQKLLQRLRRGEFPIERELDLHGLYQEEARKRVLQEVQNAWDEGERCLLIIHGRGLHSESGPTLKEELPQWLSEPSVQMKILAFSTVAPEFGGSGATAVYLRRN